MSAENPSDVPPQETPKPGGELRESIAPERSVFDSGRNTLLLDIAREAIEVNDLQDLADKNGLEEKDEFHITVVGFKNGGEIKKVLKALPEAERKSAIERIESLVETTRWDFTLEPQKYHISKEYTSPDPKNAGAELKERRESYIQIVDLPSLKVFYERLNSILGTNFEPPPAHITLFTGGDDPEKSKMGIGINTQEDFLKLNPKLIP